MTKFQLICFDLTYGLSTATKALSRNLKVPQLLYLLLWFVVRSIFTSPFRNIAKPKTPAEIFTYHQLKPALILDDVLKYNLHLIDSKRLTILEAVISEAGAKFIATNVTIPSPKEWESMDKERKKELTESTMARFLNAETSVAETPENVLGFNVTYCHFAALTRTLNREYLATLFCKADSLYFSRPEVLVQLRREHTIAEGHQHCSFRFQFSEDEDA